MPFTIAAVSAYNPGIPNSSTFVQLGALMLVLVLVPIILAYFIWKGYKPAWYATIAYGCFNIALYIIIFSSLKVLLSTGPIVSNSAIGPLGYAIAYGIAYIGTYLLAVIAIIENIGMIYFLTRVRIRAYFGM
jgi:hypothetical protein